jgi:cell wall-associated NlpC family hydrolase
MIKKERQQKLLEVARSCLGAPYKYAAQPEEAPRFFDCSSFTQYVYKKIGKKLPRSSILQATQGREIKMNDGEWYLGVGDLLFYRGTKGHYNDELFGGKQIYIGHVALYVGDGKIIHANGKTKSVTEMNLFEIKEPIVMVRRIL